MIERITHHIDSNGIETWKRNGQLHREDGPAMVEPNGALHWFYRHERHRTDGPAMIRADGREFWFVYGIHVNSFKKFQKLANVPKDQLVMLKLKYGKLR